MKKRLIELLEEEKAFSRYMTDDERRAAVADFLLENGVLVPPCKVGDTVYAVLEPAYTDSDEAEIYSWEVYGVAYEGGEWYAVEGANDDYCKIGSFLCKLTREEAEAEIRTCEGRAQ